MSDSIIEQVKRLAEAQEGSNYGTVDDSVFWNLCDRASFAKLLAHLQAQQAVVDAAREYRQVERDIRIGSAGMLNAKLAMHALDAALRALAELKLE